MAGLNSARARGRQGGKPKGLSKKAKRTACVAEVLYNQKELTTDQIAYQLDISKGTLYKYLRYRNVTIGEEQFRKAILEEKKEEKTEIVSDDYVANEVEDVST